MKKIKILFIVFAVLGILSLTTCKRASIDDPSMQVNSAFRVVLSGFASPSTLYVPDDNSSFATNLYFEAKDNKGEPVVGKQLVIKQSGPVFGYFDDHELTADKVTDSNGKVSVTYTFPQGLYVAEDQFVSVTATLVDDGRLDPESNASAIYETVPIKIVKNENTYENEYMIHGDVNLSDGTDLSGVTITLTNYGEGTYSFQNRDSGSWIIMVPEGWTGTITPSKSGYTFSPTRRLITTPVEEDHMWEDFEAVADE